MLRLPTRKRLTLAVNDAHACLRLTEGRHGEALWEEVVFLDGVLEYASRFEAIAECLRRHTVTDVALHVIVGDDLVRYAVAPWQERGVESVLARACLEHRYGSMSDWEIRLDEGVFGGGRLVSALRLEWLGGLRSLCDRFGLRCRSLLPAPVVVWNRLAHSTPEDDLIFASVSPEQAFLLTRRAGHWLAVHTIASSLDASGLQQVLQREAILQGFDALPPIRIFAPHIAQELANLPATESDLQCIGRDWDIVDSDKSSAYWLALARLGAEA